MSRSGTMAAAASVAAEAVAVAAASSGAVAAEPKTSMVAQRVCRKE